MLSSSGKFGLTIGLALNSTQPTYRHGCWSPRREIKASTPEGSGGWEPLGKSSKREWESFIHFFTKSGEKKFSEGVNKLGNLHKRSIWYVPMYTLCRNCWNPCHQVGSDHTRHWTASGKDCLLGLRRTDAPVFSANSIRTVRSNSLQH